MADSIHSVRKTLRLMPGEAKELSEKAGAAGMCEADYLRLLITQKPNDYPEIRILLKELINEVNGLAESKGFGIRKTLSNVLSRRRIFCGGKTKRK